MAFHFVFETLYRLRQSAEHQQELRLRTANQQVAKVRRAIEQLNERSLQMNANSSNQLGAGTTAAEIQFNLNAMHSLELRQRELQDLLSRVICIRDQQEEIFRQARRERETLEVIRKQQLQEHQRIQSRRQQRSLDDLFLLRRSLLKRG